MIPYNVTSIGKNAFENCTNLASVTIQSNRMESIGYRAFFGCTSLASITLPNSLTVLGGEAFIDSALTEVFLSKNIELLGSTIFDENVIIYLIMDSKADEWAQNNGYYDYYTIIAIDDNFDSATCTLPENTTTIEANAFEYDISITIFDAYNCTSIGAEAFKDTGLKSIKLPKDCVINNTAFDGCGRVFVFAPEGGLTQAFCDNPNQIICWFVPLSVPEGEEE